MKNDEGLWISNSNTVGGVFAFYEGTGWHARVNSYEKTSYKTYKTSLAFTPSKYKKNFKVGPKELVTWS